MLSALHEYQFGIAQLREFIRNNEKINKVLSYTPKAGDSPDISSSLTDIKSHFSTFRLRKVFEYNSLIISLYGCFEKYVETVILQYLNEVNKVIGHYKDLPNVIKNNHFQLSAALLNNLVHRKYENVTTKELIVENLYSCIGGEPYTLNSHAYINHTANLKHEVVCEMMNKVGIANLAVRIKENETFKEYINYKLDIPELSEVRDEIIFSKLLSLIEMRNDVAHGNSGSQILHNTIIEEYIDFMEAYGTAIHEVLYEELLKWRCRFESIPVSKVIKVINFSILCAEVENVEISIGDAIIVESGEVAIPGIMKERSRISK